MFRTAPGMCYNKHYVQETCNHYNVFRDTVTAAFLSSVGRERGNDWVTSPSVPEVKGSLSGLYSV